MFAFIVGAINCLIKLLGKVLSLLLSLLPNSPFTQYINADNPAVEFLGFINYFIPISTCIKILSAWTIAIGFVYIAQIALRWIKAME